MPAILVVVDMQHDFVSGALGTPEAKAIVPAVVQKIRSFEGDILVTFDTHTEDYLHTQEGTHLPVPHCIMHTEGWQLDPAVKEALSGRAHKPFTKGTFGSVSLASYIAETYDPADLTIELCGLCTDICVVSNALLLKAHFPEVPMTVDASCCAGVTPSSHAAALNTMQMCQIQIRE